MVHLCLKRSLATKLWNNMATWLDLLILSFHSIEDMYVWIDDRVLTNSRRSIIEVTCASLIWVLWTYQNPQVFGNNK